MAATSANAPAPPNMSPSTKAPAAATPSSAPRVIDDQASDYCCNRK